VAEEQNIQLRSELPDTPRVIRGDKSRLQRAIANLLDNALKYTPAGGTVELTCRNEADRIRVDIRDSGIGIAPEETDRIFERFYRCEKSRSTPGNGLGLSLAQTVIDAHGGTLQVRSTPNEGSVFTVTLPSG
jgi:signal transduction histidine kinase